MNSPLVQLIDAALMANLKQNELKAFLALVRQTLAYGKVSDPLTIKRLVKLSNVRKDRLEPALQGLLNAGLFESTDHAIFEKEYHVATSFLQGANPSFFAPPLPKIGEDFCKSEAFSEKQIHTIQTNTILTITDKQADVPVCDVVPTAQEELQKPEAINQQAFAELLPALKKLPNPQAKNVLALLNIAILDGSIKTTQQRLGGALIKAARANTLDTSALQCPEKPADISSPVHNPKPQPDSLAPRLNDLRSKINGLESLKKLAGELDARSMAQLQAYQIELSQLKGGIA